MLVGYMRVSTDGDRQVMDLQRDALLAAGVDERHLYEDRASGNRGDRAGLAKALGFLRPGDCLVVWKLDRLGRSLPHLLTTVTDLKARGVAFRSLTEQMDTTTAQGELVFHIFGALAQFERSLIQERVQAGLAAAARFRISVAEAEALMRPEEFDAYENIGEHYAGIRRWSPAFLDAFAFEGVPAAASLLRAIEVLREANRKGSAALPKTAPTGFIRQRWASLVLPGGAIDRRHYELCVLSELRGRVQAGDVWVTGSRRYRSFEERLISEDTLNQLQQAGTLPIAVEPEFELFIAGRHTLLDARLAGIAPEKLLRALLLQAFYSVRSERQLMEQIGYNLLFRWFVGLAMDAPVWDATTFSKNRDRLLDGDVAQLLLAAVLAQPRVRALMSDEHFSVDGTLIQAWASHKSFQPKPDAAGGDPPCTPCDTPSPDTASGRNAEQSWRGQKRSNETHRSVTDPDARLARKSNGQTSILAYAGHVLMENRNGLVAHSCLTHATGTAERDAALVLVDRLGPGRRITLGADKGYDVLGFVQALRQRRVTPHVATDRRVSKLGVVRRSGVDGRTTRHVGYAVAAERSDEIRPSFITMAVALGSDPRSANCSR